MKPFIRQCFTIGMVVAMGWASNAQAWEAGDWLVRLRGINIDPDTSSDPINAPALGGLVPGSSVRVDAAITPELDFTYMLSDHFGLELILATAEHTVSAAGAASNLGDVLDTWVLPPTLTLQYHFLPQGNVQPYIGVGANYTIFYSEDLADGFAASGDSVDLDDSFGIALQAGIDFKLDNDWFINVDVKYIDMSTDATIRNSSAGDIFVNGVDIDPWVYGIGFGKRF